ncbi:MAG: thiopurine S-methyltransferase [Gammaproteobacteria bacterium HGW-Gammaproteobacteria-10]|nr:MAG: thiopurine S-methyltransferase [Gammaproteobacteria bacterium HGW-Gammaproteobacteria-10]
MHQEFWLERWQHNQIGFHNESINPHLEQYWPALHIEAGSRVFVPLCGKSNDMLWLLAQNYRVIGVELSPLAVNAFFTENKVPATAGRKDKFEVWENDDLCIYCGDFFHLIEDDLTGVDAVYDRASLVALPPEMRADYAAHMKRFLKTGTKILLVAFDYPQQEMDGPPFSVQCQEVETLYRDWCRIDLLHTEDILSKEPRFRERGLSRLQEQVYVLTVL